MKVAAPSQAARLEGPAARPDRHPGRRRRPVHGAAARRARATPPPGAPSARAAARGPTDLPLALRKLGDLVIRQALVEVDVGERPDRPARLTIRGHLRTEDIVTLMIKTGGFEANGARLTLALTLGYTPSRLPDAVPLELRAEGRPL